MSNVLETFKLLKIKFNYFIKLSKTVTNIDGKTQTEDIIINRSVRPYQAGIEPSHRAWII